MTVRSSQRHALHRRLGRWAPLLNLAVSVLVLMLAQQEAAARNAIRSAFFSRYPAAVGSAIETLPSNGTHCGVCHFDFDGGGARNLYGNAVKARLDAGRTNAEAIADIELQDSDGDGYTTLVEVTDTTTYANTPTFPGLYQGNKTGVVHVTLSEVEPHLTPVTGVDTTPPSVTVGAPNGGETIAANGLYTIAYTATDASGIATIDVDMSEDGGATWEPVARDVVPGASFSWFVPNLPGSANRVRIVAMDNVGNVGQDASDASFMITAVPAGAVPSTLRDMKLTGSQPLTVGELADPGTTCIACHGNYDSAVEPWYVWRGSMMAHAMRDPLFLACVAVAEQDAPSVGDVCIRCHTPGGWLEGRSTDTSGGLINAKDRQSVQCDFCHRLVDLVYQPGVSPPQDAAVLAGVSPLPLVPANGQFVADPATLRRGPYGDVVASHPWVQSPLHRTSKLCGTCHDVSNPVFVKAAPGDYVPNSFDAAHPDMDLRNMFPVERTYSEWTQSQYASTGVYAPQFAGNLPGGVVSTCQDCHMRDVTGAGCNEPGSPVRTDLPLHDMTGGNVFIPDLLPALFPGEVDVAELAAGKARATAMLELAATLQLTPQDFGVRVRVINETAHKLPSGYPEGRRIWLHVAARDSSGVLVYESGAYDASSGVLTHDEDAKVYEIHLGLSPGLATALGMPAGPSFHFVLNDTVYHDNRIPPRGFTNAAFQAVQSPPVGYAYADSQYWDDTDYNLPSSADSATVTLYYQPTSKEYIEFLRDANTTNSAGQDLYDGWVAQGKAPPVVMQRSTVKVAVTTDVAEDGQRPAPLAFNLERSFPNPFRGATTIAFALPQAGHVRVAIYDLRGRLVRTLVDAQRQPGQYRARWDGRNAAGQPVASGLYFIRYESGAKSLTERTVLLK